MSRGRPPPNQGLKPTSNTPTVTTIYIPYPFNLYHRDIDPNEPIHPNHPDDPSEPQGTKEPQAGHVPKGSLGQRPQGPLGLPGRQSLGGQAIPNAQGPSGSGGVRGQQGNPNTPGFPIPGSFQRQQGNPNTLGFPGAQGFQNPLSPQGQFNPQGFMGGGPPIPINQGPRDNSSSYSSNSGKGSSGKGVYGIARRKGDINPFKWGIAIDDSLLDHPALAGSTSSPYPDGPKLSKEERARLKAEKKARGNFVTRIFKKKEGKEKDD